MKQAKIIALGLLVGLFFLATGANAADKPALPPPVKAVLTNYFKIQVALAEDSLEGVPETANALAKIIKEDTTKTLSPDVAKQAEAVAKAKDLEASREAFKPLSESLIKYLAEHKVNSNSCDEFFCHMGRGELAARRNRNDESLFRNVHARLRDQEADVLTAPSAAARTLSEKTLWRC